MDTVSEVGNLLIWEAAFNTAIYKSRIKVKWFFSEFKMLWAFDDCKNLSKVLQIPVGFIFQAAIILIDFRIFGESNEISKYFESGTPNLEQYISFCHG